MSSLKSCFFLLLFQSLIWLRIGNCRCNYILCFLSDIELVRLKCHENDLHLSCWSMSLFIEFSNVVTFCLLIFVQFNANNYFLIRTISIMISFIKNWINYIWFGYKINKNCWKINKARYRKLLWILKYKICWWISFVLEYSLLTLSFILTQSAASLSCWFV